MDNGEQQLSLSDSKFRYYSTLMERALKGFENTREWADLISALSKVNKVISSHKSYNILPKKATIGKRLAQCLHPALPAGVHIKALELYETIFTTIGPAFIAKDFPIYSAGLLPLLGHAAMTVKPVLLTLYETFILPVCSSIRPAAAGVIIGVLPGLEEGSEYHDRTNTLLEKLTKEFGVEHFYFNFWSCLQNSTLVRLPGTSFFIAHIDRTHSMEDQLYLLGSDLSLLVSALKACLEDSAVLVQRNTLDILSLAFPFHDSQLTKSDQSSVISSALLVLLRRDMSLNRRLYAWLLGVTMAGTPMIRKTSSNQQSGRERHESGSSSASEPELEYFVSHSKRLLVQSLQEHFDSVTEESLDVIRPLRIVTSLLDRAEIGSVVLEDILLNIFRLLRRFYSAHTDRCFPDNSQMSTYRLADSLGLDLHAIAQYDTRTHDLPVKVRTELVKACNLLFGTLEPNFIWEFLSNMYERVLWASEMRQGIDLGMPEYCDIINMLLSIMSLETYLETQTVHIPRLLFNLLNMLKENLTETSLSSVTQVLLLCRRLTFAIAPTELTSTDDDAVTLHDSIPFVQEVLCSAILKQSDSEIDLMSRRHALLACALLLIEMSSSPVYSGENISKTEAADTNCDATDFPDWVSMLLAYSSSSTSDRECQFICAALLIDLINLSHLSMETNQKSQHIHRQPSLDSEANAALVAVTIQPPFPKRLIDSIQVKLEDIFIHLWSAIDVERLLYSEECSFLLSRLLTLHAEGSRRKRDIDNLQNVIIKDLTHKDHVRRLEAYKKFSLFWHQTRHLQNSSSYIHHVLMVVLSSLVYETELIQEVIRDWLIHSVECDDLNRILEPYLILLLESDTSRNSVQHRAGTSEEVCTNNNISVSKTTPPPPPNDINSVSNAMYFPNSVRKCLNLPHDHEGALGSDSGVPRATESVSLNPFGTVSDLDQLIFAGFTPHETLKNRWAPINNGNHVANDCASATLPDTSEQVPDVTNRPEISNDSTQDTDVPTVSSTAIPLPNKEPSVRQKELPPPLVDPETQQFAEQLVEDILSQATGLSIISPTETQREPASSFSEASVSGSHQQVTDTCSVMSSTSIAASTSGASIESISTAQQEEDGDGEKSDKLHGFVLLYDQCYDTERVLFALSVIQKVVGVSSSLVLSNLTTSPCSDPRLLNLLARQMKAIEGENYYTELTPEELISLRNTRLLEVLVTVCLYFWRSYHPERHAADGCVVRNSHVQLRAINLLMIVLTDVTHTLADSPKGFPEYMVDVLYRCKVVKTCLFHLQSLLLENRNRKLGAVGATHDSSVDLQMFSKCLQLAECLIRLESKLLLIHEHQNSTVKGGAPVLFKRMMFSHPSLLNCLNTHLSQAKHASVHHQWVSMITNSLPHVLAQSVTADVVENVVVRMCKIFDRVSVEERTTLRRYPPDYVQQLLEDFTVICHFCFMDLTNTMSQSEESKPAGISTSQLLSNLISVFNPLSTALKTKLGSSHQDSSGVLDSDLRLKCRDRLLSMMPKILASVSTLWRSAQAADNQKVVQLVIGFFSPILHNYTEQLLGSVAVVWSDSQDGMIGSQPAQSTQSTLVELLLCIKALPMDTIVDKLGAVMKRPPNTNHQTNTKVLLQLSCLKFLRGYIIKTPAIAKSSLGSVCSLLKHCLQLGLPPPGVLLLLETATEFVHKLGVIEDRKVIKDLQEIVGKVLDAFCQIISAQLEASSWTIRKNYTVKVRSPAADSGDLYGVSDAMSNSTVGITVEDNVSTEEHESECTSHALALLAEVTAGLLDVVYPSEDKDKVITLLSNVLSRIFPYLRNHSLLNMTCFQSSSKLLASISSYQHTRRTWRRDVYDILLSAEFFKMDVQSLQFWKTLADNLITHEKSMFKDLLARFAMTPSTIPLFSTKDFEQAQSVQNLKRLAFIIYSGDVDHYKHHMPDIQERLAENLRLSHAPAALSQGFLCFRVLLMKMSPDALTSIWPTVITELGYVMTQIEQDLSLSDEEERQMARVSEVDSFSSLNEVNVHHSSSWLSLYLSACKLLDLLLFLPPHTIPDFQNYIWMFTGSDDITASKSVGRKNFGERKSTGFSSHIPRISKMMEWKFGAYNSSSTRRNSLLLQEQTIANLADLQPFFARIMEHASSENFIYHLSMLEQVESVIDNDFIEPVT